MNTKVFLVRHGETEWNRMGKFQGSQDTNLTKEGITQAKYLSKRFSGNFDYIYTSPLKRAVQTANIITKNEDIKPTIINDLREISFGEWESLTAKEIESKFPKEFSIWKSDAIEAPLCGGDLSIRKASIRSEKAIKSIVSKHEGKHIIIIAHGGIIISGLIAIFNWDMTMYHKIALGNTAVCEIDFDHNLNPKIIKLNDTSHLP